MGWHVPLRPGVVAGLLGLILMPLLAGCTTGGTTPGPTQTQDSATRAAAELAAGLAAKDLSKVEFAGAESKTVNEQFAALVVGMGSLKPTVQVGRVDVSGSEAAAAANVAGPSQVSRSLGRESAPRSSPMGVAGRPAGVRPSSARPRRIDQLATPAHLPAGRAVRGGWNPDREAARRGRIGIDKSNLQ
jgi:hypothetical protein